MNLRNKSRQSFLASIFIFTFISLVHAGMTEDGTANVQSASMSDTTTSKYSDIDIIGLKLGMTKDQVITTLKKHNRNVLITFNEFKVPEKARKQNVSIPDHLQAINAEMGNIKVRPYESIVIRFASPPAISSVNEIVRSSTFAQDILTDTVMTALKEKYGTPTAKSRMLVWEYSIKSSKNSGCHMMPYFGNQGRYYQSQCSGLELIAMVATNKKILSSLTTILIDHGEIKKQIVATTNYQAQLKQERREEKLKKASQGSAITL